MKGVAQLPAGYTQREQIDLQNNKKLAVLVNVLALVIAAALAAVGFWAMLRGGAEGLLIHFTWGQLAVAVVGTVVYMVLHELVHGVCMRYFSGMRPRYGFTGMYAYAGSDAYFDKASYIFIALAPVVLWGVVLQVLCLLAPVDWFWVVYFIQIMNLSGAAGDLYVTWHFSRLPKDILVQDTGVSMTVYGRE